MRLIEVRRAARLLCLAPLSLCALSAQAADATFSSEGAFVAAAGITAIESFESLAGRLRGLLPVAAPLLTISTTTTPVGLQTAPDSPDNGFGSAATDGTHYVSMYAPGVSQDTIRIDLASPGRAFGFNIVDLGEAVGTLHVRTDTGAFATGTTLGTYDGSLANGNVQFFGLTQDVAFTSVFITVNGIDDAYSLDKLYVSAVPEPASGWALLGGLLGMCVWRARARAQTALRSVRQESTRG